MTPRRFSPVLLLLAVLTACQPSYHLAQQAANRIQVDSTTATADPGMASFLQPYRQKLDQTMNAVLARSTGPIEKSQPNGPLNDILTDALLQQASQKYGKPIDVSHLNFGGIRNNLPAGNITIGSIYEVMPFDNKLVILTLTGDMLMQLLNHFAEGNKLVVGGLRATIHDGKVQSATLTNGRAIQPSETYTVAMSDYVAEGGDNAGFLKNPVKREDINYLIRDALIDYFRQRGQSGQPITPTTDGRITIE
ncbi:5'-Nucleotidase domain protein [Fibrisoma limi BUZ 3]|uniref:5'-Nucleotidase domain protein n=1 Tax=Fibrisoma limi BUZ 3 TaxID=1185876 RepID=I2GPU5_9BACT|nr:5'-nucleotidase C-terminal domain-containing protein [Fibrisoma limi]CCH55923.1 5'-Nucleotidase domain protein [Fibrisoma limi BUZ 3]